MGGTAAIDWPICDPSVDDVPWIFPAHPLHSSASLGITLSGLKSYSSTVLHWAARLSALYGEIRALLWASTSYAPSSD